MKWLVDNDVKKKVSLTESLEHVLASLSFFFWFFSFLFFLF